MPVIWRASAQGKETSVSGFHMLTEDPRAGHNVMYIGQDQLAIDAISLKPLYGLAGTMRMQSTTSSYGGATYCYSNNGHNHEQGSTTYMMLAGKHPCGYGRNGISSSWNNSSLSLYNAPASITLNMDSENRREYHQVKDNGDGTSTIMMNNQVMGNFGHEGYSAHFDYVNIPDDHELYEVAPNSHNSHTTTVAVRGTNCGYTALDGTNSGFLTMTNMVTSYPAYPNITMMLPGSSYSVENSYGSGGSVNGYYHQFCGMSRADGLPIFIERRHSPYQPWFRFVKWSGSAWTTLLDRSVTSNGTHPFSGISTVYTYSTLVAGAGTDTDYNSGTNDSYGRFGSTWFRNGSIDSKYLFTIQPLSYKGVPFFDIFRWDTTTDTFVGAGMQGVSTGFATFYHNNYNASTGYETTVDDYLWTPKGTGSTLPGSSLYSNNHQALTANMHCDVHGYTNANGSTSVPFDPQDAADTGIVAMSVFNSSGEGSFYDANFKGRSIGCYTTDQYSSNDYYYNLVWRGATIVPETPLDWVWCDEGKTTIAAICANNTYIYQCRKGASITHGITGGDIFSYNNATSSSTFNVNPDADQMGWVHTATIPYSVLQMGIDKYDRLWYVTHEVPTGYVSTTPDNTKYYHKQMWMITTATPFKINLTGNATTDTISYSGSNIDKTLTIEALNFKAQRVAKTITLTIHGSDAQFDNGAQTKDVTTSSSGTVDETITITGAGSFNITAAYGA